MPFNYNNNTSYNTDMLDTFNNTMYAIRHSNNKNDAIKTLSNTKINGSNIKLGNQTAHQIYDKYVEYNGHGSGRNR